MATLPSAIFTSVPRGAGRYWSPVPTAAAIARVEQRIDGCCSARGLPVIAAAATSEELARSVAPGHRSVCFRSDLRMLQAGGAERAGIDDGKAAWPGQLW